MEFCSQRNSVLNAILLSVEFCSQCNSALNAIQLSTQSSSQPTSLLNPTQLSMRHSLPFEAYNFASIPIPVHLFCFVLFCFIPPPPSPPTFASDPALLFIGGFQRRNFFAPVGDPSLAMSRTSARPGGGDRKKKKTTTRRSKCNR